MTTMPNTARACVKSADAKFGNDHIFDLANFDESGRRKGDKYASGLRWFLFCRFSIWQQKMKVSAG